MTAVTPECTNEGDLRGGIVNTILWDVQAILAIKFLAEAFSHVFQTGRPVWQFALQRLGARSGPATAVSCTAIGQGNLPATAVPPQVRLVLRVSSIFMALGAIGLIVPAATGILSWLTPLAAALLALLMLRGILFHLRCRAKTTALVNLVLAALAVFVTYGRWFLVPL